MSLLLERQQVKHALLNQSTNSQTSVRGELEAVTCAILASDIFTRWRSQSPNFSVFSFVWRRTCHGRDVDAVESFGEYWIDNNQVDILAKQGAVIGGPPQALERAETTRRHHEIATAILEERDHPGPWVDAKS